MDFNEALKLSQQLNETEKDKIYLDPQGFETYYWYENDYRGHTKAVPKTTRHYDFLWQGYTRSTNVSAEFFDKYLS